MVLVALCAVAMAAAGSLRHNQARLAPSLEDEINQEATQQFNYLIGHNYFFECPDAVVLDTEAMGIVDMVSAEQQCVSNPSCTYFLWWTMGVKPSMVDVSAGAYRIIRNEQAICAEPNIIKTKAVSALSQAAAECDKEPRCSHFSMNLLAGGEVGPTAGSHEVVFCSGQLERLSIDGFVVGVKQTGVRGPPRAARALAAPCDINGPITHTGDIFAPATAAGEAKQGEQGLRHQGPCEERCLCCVSCYVVSLCFCGNMDMICCY
ncbi:unnamed protein product [Vitrella brassicaformis CCMP3155]|uniref:SUEL-type lectin domain-containing protein n=1 Tax=Vitrella brassicaformis (strain CCMP3155) TaxID=1169540 RepID=A0A0G4FSP5_VITBC|nr:unnamed protein product [Vitrella brassicaformis CCMP3155]|eukprot:CEM17727.1 unnamed protein product [Vitrella brassicaformis CCMP3155]